MSFKIKCFEEQIIQNCLKNYKKNWNEYNISIQFNVYLRANLKPQSPITKRVRADKKKHTHANKKQKQGNDNNNNNNNSIQTNKSVKLNTYIYNNNNKYRFKHTSIYFYKT
jgi:hypothetical protein